ncbi:MAG: peptidase [Acidobacteria bacterium]|nr:peptidase [Acidobacteriota bacterium]
MNKPLIGIGSDLQLTPGKRDRAFAYMTYIESLRNAGAVPVLIPPQPENAADVVAGLDGLLLAGGDDCDPAAYGEERHATCEPMDIRRQDNDLALARAARELGVPTLGICLGMQVMNVAAGGTLIQDIASQFETEIQHVSEPEDRARHDVMIDAGTKLASIVGAAPEMNVNSSHHQAIRKVGEGLRAAAHAPDGIVEGLEDPKHPFYVGVQWHPEDMRGEPSATSIFGAFIEAARRRATGRKQTATEMSHSGGSRSE